LLIVIIIAVIIAVICKSCAE